MSPRCPLIRCSLIRRTAGGPAIAMVVIVATMITTALLGLGTTTATAAPATSKTATSKVAVVGADAPVFVDSYTWANWALNAYRSSAPSHFGDRRHASGPLVRRMDAGRHGGCSGQQLRQRRGRGPEDAVADPVRDPAPRLRRLLGRRVVEPAGLRSLDRPGEARHRAPTGHDRARTGRPDQRGLLVQGRPFRPLRDAQAGGHTLSADHGSRVYIDGGHSRWLSAQALASRLRSVGVSRARGFSLNVGQLLHHQGRDQLRRAGGPKLVGGKHYVVDTSRNGLGPAPAIGQNWCNPAGRALGSKPTLKTGRPVRRRLSVDQASG